MEKKINTRWQVHTGNTDGGKEKWYLQGGFDNLKDAIAKAKECSDTRKTRVVRCERFVVEEFESQGKEIKSFSFSLDTLTTTPNYK